MSRLLRADDHMLIAVVIGVTVLAAIHLVWLHVERAANPLDIDEAAYASAAYDDAHAMQTGGLHALWDQYRSVGGFAPLLPLLASPIQLVVGARVIPTMSAQLVFYAVLTVTTYLIGRRVMRPRWAAMAALLVSTAPGIVAQARTFEFSLTAAATYALAMWALMASDRLRSLRWSLAWGLFVGLSLLARTMMVGLVPGVIVAAIVGVAMDTRDRRQRLLHLGAGLTVALVVAGTWYGPNLATVFGYLSGYGYGSPSADYGARHSPASLDFWTVRASLIASRELLVPLSYLVVAGGVAAIVLAVMGRGSETWRSYLRRWLSSDMGVLAIVTAEGYVALTSTTNRGSAFEEPLLMPMIVLAAAAFSRVRPGGRRVWFAVAAMVAAVNVASTADVIDPLSRQQLVSILPGQTVVDGASVIRRYIQGRNLSINSVTATPQLPPSLATWTPTNAALASRLTGIAHERGREPVIFFETRDRFLNTNSLGAAYRYELGTSAPPMGQLTAKDGGDTTENYRVHLDAPQYGQPNILISGDPAADEFRPIVTQTYAEQAAREMGFTVVDRVPLPDGRELRIWWIDRGPTHVQG